MMIPPRVGTTLTIEIRIEAGAYSLQLYGYGQDSKPFPDVGDDSDLVDMRRIAMEGLADFKRAVVQNRSDSSVTFNRLGTKLLTDMLGDRVNEYLNDFYEYVRKSFLNWYTIEESVPRVTLRAPAAHMVPIELLPFEGIGRQIAKADVNDSYYNHLGFAAVVNRIMNRMPDLSIDRQLRNVPKLPVAFIRNTSLQGSNDEAHFLAADERIQIDGPWPDTAADLSKGLETIIGILYDPCKAFNGARNQAPDQIEHLSCHGRFNEAHPELSKLLLGCADGEFPLLLADLTEGFGAQKIKTPGPRQRPDLPLVFLNACESAVAAGTMSAASFPRHFLRWGNRAVIGSEAAIPDDVAAKFSRMFYEGILDDGLPVGDAVFQARIRLLARGNPLGILYTFYGDPDLVVQRSGNEKRPAKRRV
jgi:hypothetical protein